MAQPNSDLSALAEQLRTAFAEHDLEAFGALLTDDARWGDGDQPRACRSRADVVATFGRLLSSGADGHITELVPGPGTILCGLRIDRLGDIQRPAGTDLFHVYMVREGRVAEIRSFDDRASALAAAGIG